MPFLIGKNEQVSNVNPATGQAQQKAIGQLTQGDIMSYLFPQMGINEQAIAPFRDLFAQQNYRAGAQAKESVGNLTGSSLGNIVGREMADASTQQNAFLANFSEQARQNDANRYAAALLGLLNSNAGGVTNMYTPGLLDYAGQAAVGLASGGAFNSLFDRTKK